MKRKNTKIIFLTILLILLITLLIYYIFNKKPTIKNINTKYYTINYDSTWNLQEKKEEIIKFKHKNGKLTINITNIGEANNYLTIDELIDEIIYILKSQNKDYKLISKEKDKLTQYEFDGYQLLFEKKDEQVMVSSYKKGDKLITVIFEADSAYFDLLLDSANNIIYNLNVKDETFNLTSKINLETKKIVYDKNSVLDKIIDKQKSIQIANNNFQVELKIPNIFKPTILDSSKLSATYLQDNGNISLSAMVFNQNMYQYLEDLQEEAKNYEEKDNYYDVNISLDKNDSKYDSYIYAIQYKFKNMGNNEKFTTNERITVLYALDNTHTLRIELSSMDCSITEKLLKNILLVKATNYSSYIVNETKGEYIVSNLKWYESSTKKDISELIIKVPNSYVELDKQRNIYQDRYFAKGYNDKLDEYDYVVHYQYVDTYSKDKTEEMINSYIDNHNSTYFVNTYGNANKLVYVNDIILNGKSFKVYDGQYIDKSGIMMTNINRYLYTVNKKVLIYQLPTKGFIWIDIRGNDVNITDEILNDITNFSLKGSN